MTHDWPGNIREFKNCIQYACALSINENLSIKHFPEYLKPTKPEEEIDISIMERHEKDTIELILKESHFNKRETADRLGISRSTLYNKMDKYGINLKKIIRLKNIVLETLGLSKNYGTVTRFKECKLKSD